MPKTLAELKAENAKLEAEGQENNGQESQPGTGKPETTSNETAANENLTDDDEGNANPTDDTADESGVEDWMIGDDEASQEADRKFTGSDIKAAKNNLRAKLDKKHASELEDLKAQIDELKSGRVLLPNDAGQLKKPTRAQFDDDDDPDESYTTALVEWKLNRSAAENKASLAQEQLQARQQQVMAKVSEDVDQHYARAMKLAGESNITAETYQGADLRVRQGVESVMPERGDQVVDGLISMLGEGSEKVFYSLGVNKTRLSTFQDKLKEDPSGLTAAMYLGALKAQLAAPPKRKTSAPAPAEHADGLSSGGKPASAGSFKNRYDAADKRGDIQERFNIRRKAKAQGVDVSKW